MRQSKYYSPDYIEKCFIIWYGLPERPYDYGLISKALPPDEHGRNPTKYTIRNWYVQYGWADRANELDSKAIQKVETTLINRKAALLQKQAEDAFVLADKAHAYLISGTFDSSAAAVNAYFRATEEVRKVIGLSDLLQRLGQMSDEEVQNEIKSRLIRASEAGQIIVDGETTEELASDSDEETP